MDPINRKKMYLNELEARSSLPAGFTAGAVSFAFHPAEKKADTSYLMNLSALVLDQPTDSFTGFFTRNRSAGAPVLIGRGLLDRDTVSGVLTNNKIANVAVPGGVENARRVVDSFCGSFGLPKESVFPASTGIIGWSLPVPELCGAASELAHKMKEAPSYSMLPVARAIMTTDTFPKVRSVSCGDGRIVATAKGAGMIEPNLATMLVYIVTDISIDRESLRDAAVEVIERTFNRISIDSDQSTSDMVLLFSSRRKPAVSSREFTDALEKVCAPLADDIVRNGEGTAHVIQVEVHGADSDSAAAGYGKAVINSPLVKTAIFGNDPNVGRIVMALGDYAGKADPGFDPERVMISLGGETIFRDGAFRLDDEKEKLLSGYLKECSMDYETTGFPQHGHTVDINVSVGNGPGSARVLGSDLSYGYISVNADYRT